MTHSDESDSGPMGWPRYSVCFGEGSANVWIYATAKEAYEHAERDGGALLIARIDEDGSAMTRHGRRRSIALRSPLEQPSTWPPRVHLRPGGGSSMNATLLQQSDDDNGRRREPR